MRLSPFKFRLLKNSLPISEVGKILGRIRNGKIVMNGKTNATGKLDYVITKDGEILLGRKHTFMSGGQDVYAAGELKLRDGKIVEVNNLSGHYMSGAEDSNNFLGVFKALGADVNGSHLKVYNSNWQVINHVVLKK